MVFVYIEEYADDVGATWYFDVLKCALHPLIEKACIYFLIIFENNLWKKTRQTARYINTERAILWLLMAPGTCRKPFIYGTYVVTYNVQLIIILDHCCMYTYLWQLTRPRTSPLDSIFLLFGKLWSFYTRIAVFDIKEIVS